MIKYECVITAPKTHKLFIGDVVYVLDDQIIDDVWGKRLKYNDGVIKDDEHVYAITSRTEYGDGRYTDGKHCFYVDAGNIGVVSMDYERADSFLDGYVLRIQHSAYVVETFNNGIISITIRDNNNRAIVLYDGEIDTRK